jgi:hypothetical protein
MINHMVDSKCSMLPKKMALEEDHQNLDMLAAKTEI